MRIKLFIALITLVSVLSCAEPPAVPQEILDKYANATTTTQGNTVKSKTPVITNFTASSSSIKAGTEITLNWEVTNADTVSINPDIGSVPGRSSGTVRPDSNVTYTLSATNNNGTSTASLDISVIPQSTTASFNLPEVAVFTAKPANIIAEQPVTLTWDVRNAYDVMIEPGLRIIRVKDSAIVKPDAPTTYKLTATNDQGTIIATTTVTVSFVPPNEETPVIHYLTVDRYVIKKGETAVLSWKTTEASSVSIDKGVGIVSGTGITSVMPAETTTYMMIAVNPRGGQYQTVTVNVK